MTHELTIGATVVRYAVRESTQARAMRIVATPSGVEVVVPVGTAPDAVAAYVDRKRRWVFDAVRDLAARHEALLAQHYGSGAKLQYRGRWLMLDVASADVEAVEIACRSKLHVAVPAPITGVARWEAVRAAFDGWLRARARDDLERWGRKHAPALDVTPGGFRLSEARSRWGSCGRDGVIRAHWQLIQAPAAAFEYVVAHEVTHLAHRHHGEAFWHTLARTLPAWPERKALLERWESERRAV